MPTPRKRPLPNRPAPRRVRPIRWSDDELDASEKRAVAAGLTWSDYVRRRATGAL